MIFFTERLRAAYGAEAIMPRHRLLMDLCSAYGDWDVAFKVKIDRMIGQVIRSGLLVSVGPSDTKLRRNLPAEPHEAYIPGDE